jgi:hypothetical protein
VRDQATRPDNPPPCISPGGVLVVEGFGAALRVDGSHLKVRSGTGRRIAEASFARITKPKLRRVVVIAGPAGYLSIPGPSLDSRCRSRPRRPRPGRRGTARARTHVT